MRRALLLLAVVSCAPGPARPKERAPHPQFPIEPGDKHGAVQCVSCHPLTESTFSKFDCVTCHESVRGGSDGIHGDVCGYEKVSRSCYGCHPDATKQGAVPANTSDPLRDVYVEALVPTFSGNAIVDFIDAGQTIPMVMNHAATTARCGACHVDAKICHLYPGQFHLTDAGVPAKCNSCHANAAPVGFVGPPQLTRIPPSGPMRHETITADCSWCHVPPTDGGLVSWAIKKAPLHAALSDGGQSPATCLECHANSMPGVVNADAGFAVPRGLQFNHQAAIWADECSECHHQTNAWAPGFFHDTRSVTSCLPCHAGQRLAEDDGGVRNPPFDLITNARGVTHGGGQDCAFCHRPATWRPATYSHDAGLALSTCVACHSTQRPTMPTDSGFVHATAGTGDCFGCHQATSQHTALSDWRGGTTFPGGLIASDDKFITVTQYTLRREDAGIAGINTTSLKLYNAMLHASPFALDAGEANSCWHCHTADPGTTNVTSFLNGAFHPSLTSFRDAPDAGVSPIAQPTSRCTDCHSNMRPPGIVQNTSLKPMDHSFSAADCSLCHAAPGASWNDGVLHSRADAGSLDCASCHWTLVEDSSQTVDVVSTASPGPKYRMQHRSRFMPTQRCDTCHTQALGRTGTVTSSAFNPGVVHAAGIARPQGCVDCHKQISMPADLRQSTNNGQWMNHQAALVTARDCAFCHSEQAGMTWLKSTRLHIPGIAPSACRTCHGQNVPPGLDDTATVTSSSVSPGVRDQIAHSDVNVLGRDCNFCHRQVGSADGDTWATQATFHASFTGGNALQLNGSSGRCSNCHLNVKPAAGLTAQDHAAFSGTGTDCSSCHQWPGSTGAASPSWRRPAAAPQTISVGGFVISQPPASTAGVTQAGVNGLSHPAVPMGGSCTSCHAMASGGRQAFGYDHAQAPATQCSSCHEAGSNLVGTPWTLSPPNVAASCAMGTGMIADRGGDTRPTGITALACSLNAASKTCGSASCASNHFFPVDCGECHGRPSGTPATVTTGAPYVAAWRFVHNFGAPTQSSTCTKCH